MPDHDTYLVLEDFGHLGCFWRETDAEGADRHTLIRDLVEGQYRHPVRVIAFMRGTYEKFPQAKSDLFIQRKRLPTNAALLFSCMGKGSNAVACINSKRKNPIGCGDHELTSGLPPTADVTAVSANLGCRPPIERIIPRPKACAR